MTYNPNSIRAACVLWLLGAFCAASPGQQDPPTPVRFQFRVGGKVSTVYTPGKILRKGGQFSLKAGAGRLKIMGKQLLMAGRYGGDHYKLGLDCNGDEQIAGDEWVRVGIQDRSARFSLVLEEGEKRRAHSVMIADIAVGVRANKVINLGGRVVINGCMAGVFREHDVWLYDDNLDGKFTQDGADAIAIGASPGAMPLMRFHQVGKYHYSLEVAPDGTQVTFRRIDHMPLGCVQTLIDPTVLGCLMLFDESSGQAYDVKVSGLTGIPAGTYKLSYAVLGSEGRIVVAGPSPKSLDYAITRDSVNLLRFGPPVTLVFSAYLGRRAEQLYVRGDIVPYGMGGERYDMRLAGFHRYGEGPHVVFTDGKTILTNGHMAYNDQDHLLEFFEWVPAGLVRETGRVGLTCQLPVLGEATGIHTFANVLARKKTEPPTPGKPAVKVGKLPEGVRLGARPPAPRPPKPVPPPTPVPTPTPTPTPTTKPTTPPKPRSEDPEYEAQRLFDLAQTYFKQGRKDVGEGKLREIVGKYPDTAAGKRADDLLLEIELLEEEEKNE